MRASRILTSIALGLAPSVALAATDERAAARHLLQRLVESERAPLVLGEDLVGSNIVRKSALRPPMLPESAMDCVHAAHDITLDPASGVTEGRLELRVRAANEALGAIGLVVDQGLAAVAATATGRETTIADAVFAPSRVVRVDLSPALPPGEETTLTVSYSGTLACARPASGAAHCALRPKLGYFAHRSIFPYIFDPDAPTSVALDGLTREIVLRVPAEREIVVTGEMASERVVGGTKVSSWSIGEPLARVVGLYALVGALGSERIAARSAPTTLYYPAPRGDVDRALAAWSGPALDFVEQVSGAKLPFSRGLSLVRLPKALGDPGTATFGMTLLSDSYASAGALMHEETWAHENAHLFWGVVIPEIDSSESRLMSEGMATLTQLEYSYARHFASEDRDAYLARRLLPMGLDLQLHGADLPPAQLRPGTAAPADFRTSRYTLWAYFRTAIVLDHLRATLGDDVFADVLGDYRARCRYVGCRPDALRAIATERSGKDIGAFFDRWVTANERPRVVVGFTPAPGGVDVELTKADARPMTLELWLELADGGRARRRVDLGPRTTRVHVDAPAPALKVRASPRHDVLVDVRSAIDGDLDFDGETDGFDLLRCARLIGQTYDSKGAAGLWNLDEAFDPRCDVNDDRSIDDDDLEHLSERFGALRPR